MINNYTILGIFFILVIVYFWRILKEKKTFPVEFTFFALTGMIIFLIFFGKDIFERINGDATALKTKSLNYFERLAKDLPSLEVPNKINNPNAPKIKITSPQDGQVFSDKIKNIIVTAEISDDNDRNPAVYGVGKFSLEPGLNPVIVVAVDKDGNANNSFVVVERSQ